MPVAAIERELHDACARLAESAAVARRCHDRYLDGPGGLPGMAGRGRVGPDLVRPDLVGRTLAGRDLVTISRIAGAPSAAYPIGWPDASAQKTAARGPSGVPVD